MLPGVYAAKKKDGTTYYRSNITYRNKHISLGSFPSELLAHHAYSQAGSLLENRHLALHEALGLPAFLHFEKIISLINFRDNQMYIKTPIYLHANYFSYYISAQEEYKFDIDDLFFYSSHKIIKRGGHLFINEYGMQTSILSRYSIKNFSVAGRDYLFANGDSLDYRYSNIIIINRYYGVTLKNAQGSKRYCASIHINGNYKIGEYDSEAAAAIAYNKAVDQAISHGVKKKFPENYVLEYTAKEYAELYSTLKLSRKYLKYLETL